ncbi:MAG: hypothetical protein IJ760_02100 [Bacteroidales bacterium]|nr:hypothetical protein [Bacteroidales bacterium]
MKQFVRTAAITALLFAALAAVLTLLIVRKNCAYSYKADYMQRHKADIKTLVVGHSHMMNGVIPAQLADSCFNLAIHGTAMSYSLMLLEHFVPQMPKLQTVIMPLSHDMEWFSFDKLSVREKRLLYGHYFNLWSTRPTLEDMLLFLHSRTFLESATDIDTALLGFEPQSIRYEGNSPYWRQCSQNNELLPSLIKIGQVCRDHGVRLIVVSAPFAPSYRVWVTQAEMDRVAGIIDSAHSQVPFDYRSYLSDPDFGSDTMFRDGTHLNSDGAVVFTRRLKQDFGL